METETTPALINTGVHGGA